MFSLGRLFFLFFLIGFEEMRRPRCAGVPKQKRRAEIQQCEQEADDKCDQEKVSEENDFVAVYAAIIYTSDGRSITNGFAGLIR